jgi:hypothetical protein
MAGVAAEYKPPDVPTAKIITHATMTSDHPLFYKAVGLTHPYLEKAGWFPSWVSSCLILVHLDRSADVYCNFFGMRMSVRPKRAYAKGETLTDRDIADVRDIDFPNIEILETDALLLCLKVGWKFALHYDLSRIADGSYKLDIDELRKHIAAVWRYLMFEDVYRTLATPSLYAHLKDEGWFPFIEIMADEFRVLAEIYETGRDVRTRVESLLASKFDAARVERMTSKWWGKDPFSRRREILVAGLNAYKAGTNDGYIQCIKTLVTEIEGIARDIHLIGAQGGTGNLWEHLHHCAFERAGSEASLYLPKEFDEYLREVVRADFNPSAAAVPMSRHSASHGAASPEQYTRARALQVILVLDQISYYI